MTRLAGRYRLEERIAHAGVGTVWVALDERSGQPVSVRFLERGADDARRVDLFRASAYAAARLRHPYIARVLDEGDGPLGPFIVTEWVDGLPLIDWIGGRPPWGFVKAVLTRVCDALAYLHARDMVHLALRPESILIIQTPEGPDVRLVGVGCTRIDEGHGDERPGARLTLKYHGSLRYLAPEVVESPPWVVGPWSDLYALGLILWALLMGDIPFGEQRGVALMLARKTEPPPVLPSDAGRPHHATLSVLLKQLLERDAVARPTSAAWVGQVLASLEGAPRWVAPRPEHRVQRPPLSAARLPVSAFALHPLQPSVLVERDAAIGAVWENVQAMQQGFGSRLVVLEGGMATAKSRLVAFVADHAEVQGLARIWRVRFQPGQAPSTGLAGTLERQLRAGAADLLGLTERAEALGPLLGLSEDAGFAQLVPGLLRPTPTAFARPPNALDLRWEVNARCLLVGAFSELIRKAAGRAPLMLWLDDVHFAHTDAAVELVEGVLADGDLPVCVVVTARRDHPTTAVWRARFPDGDPVRWIGVEPMTQAGADAYLNARTGLVPNARAKVLAAVGQDRALLPDLVDWLLSAHLTTSAEGYVLNPAVMLPETADELRSAVFEQLPAAGADLLVPDVVAGLALAQVPITALVIEALEADDPNRPYRRALFAAERGRWMAREPLGGWRFTRPELAEWLRAHHQTRAESWHRRWSRALLRLEGEARGQYGAQRAWHAELLGEPEVALAALLDAASWSLGPGQTSTWHGLAAAEQAEALANRLRDPIKAAHAGRLRACLLRSRGDFEGARAALVVAQRRLTMAAPNHVEQGWCQLTAGWLALDRGDLAAASTAFNAAEPIFGQAGDKGGGAWSLVGHGQVQVALGHFAMARRLGHQAEQTFTALDAARGGLAARALRAHAADAGGDWPLAEQRYAVLQALVDQHRWHLQSTSLRLRRARVALLAQRPHDSLRLLDEAEGLATALVLEPMQAWIAAVRPAVHAAAGDAATAREALGQARLPSPAASESASATVQAALAVPSARLDRSLYEALEQWCDRLREQAVSR
jgi:hypothetical protein